MKEHIVNKLLRGKIGKMYCMYHKGYGVNDIKSLVCLNCVSLYKEKNGLHERKKPHFKFPKQKVEPSDREE